MGYAIHIEDDGIWTSAGATAGMDLALALIEADLGRKVARMSCRRARIHGCQKRIENYREPQKNIEKTIADALDQASLDAGADKMTESAQTPRTSRGQGPECRLHDIEAAISNTTAIFFVWAVR
jgi:transcriptional regulator GlxA family with amidase domain